ncbi:hypothetical protein ACK32U_05685 [Aeromonas dhakensis]|uniref:hypothetical protein n=1 Tax=Aeromonas TaxID=642 RepID=UPI001F00B0BE|nr:MULTISPECIES: hypothetical protein [Aeromonas]GKQ98978.1 hypothetical protein KAM461_32280 [Aeromonas hydrophila]
MSDAIKIANQAPKLIEGLLADMFAARADDNRVCLGSVWSGPQHIQIQLVATSSPDALLDDDSSDDEYAEPNEPVQPKSGLWLHWQSYRADYIGASNATYGTDAAEVLALGAIRSIYWLALGQGETPLATEIGDWWKECAPLHGLGEVIR